MTALSVRNQTFGVHTVCVCRCVCVGGGGGVCKFMQVYIEIYGRWRKAGGRSRICIMGLNFQEPITMHGHMGQYFQNSNNTRNTLNQPAAYGKVYTPKTLLKSLKTALSLPHYIKANLQKYDFFTKTNLQQFLSILVRF